jgi:hypothetical protein
LHQQDGYLIYRSGKKYTLFYWDRQWKEATTKVYQGDDMKLVFENVPDKTLLLLRPEYSEGKERVFTVDDDGVRHWW